MIEVRDERHPVRSLRRLPVRSVVAGAADA